MQPWILTHVKHFWIFFLNHLISNISFSNKVFPSPLSLWEQLYIQGRLQRHFRTSVGLFFPNVSKFPFWIPYSVHPHSQGGCHLARMGGVHYQHLTPCSSHVTPHPAPPPFFHLWCHKSISLPLATPAWGLAVHFLRNGPCTLDLEAMHSEWLNSAVLWPLILL